MTTYTHATLGDFKSALALRLGDAAKTHWISDELGTYAIETIRTFNVLALGYHRDSAVISTSSTSSFYDLPTALPLLLPYTVRDQDLIGSIQYQFMEPKSVLVWAATGSEMWTMAEVVAELQESRNQFLTDTACSISNHVYSIGAVSYFDLPTDTVTSIRRVAWRSLTGRYYNLFPSDELTFTTAPSWRQSTSTPSRYSIVSSTPLRIQFNSTFPTPGTLDLLVVESGADLDPTANSNTGMLLGVPDDFAWGVKYGAMGCLLRKEGPAKDIARADWCDTMYQLAVDLCNQFSPLLTATVRDVAVPIRAMMQLDALRPGWQGQNSDTPASVAVAGLNMISTYPRADGAYPVNLSVARNAIVPSSTTADAEYLQISRDDIGGVIAWAEMLAAFKSEGASFDAARTGAQELTERAAAMVGRRVISSSTGRNVFGYSRDDFSIRPLVAPESRPSSSERSGGDTASKHQSRKRSNDVRHRTRLGGR